jgi:hypothetical protein
MRELGMGPKVYNSFEEFEREELRRLSSVHVSIDDYMDECFCEELDFDPEFVARRRKRDEDGETDE